MIRFGLTTMLVSTALACPALAQGSAEPDVSRQHMIGQADQEFLNYVAQDNQGEIQLCLLAEKRVQNPAMRAFARLMVNDHVQVESQLAAVASATGVKVPDDIGQDAQKTLSHLLPLSGAEFDRAFIKGQIEDHAHDVHRFEHEQQSAQDPNVKKLAALTLPILQQHLQLAQAVQSSLQGGKSHE